MNEMRLYKPQGTIETLDRLLADPQIAEAVVAHRILPERPAQTAPFPGWLDKRLVRALHGQGIEMLYTHQAESLDALRRGDWVAFGKAYDDLGQLLRTSPPR